VTVRVVHVSDLHTGTREDPLVEDALRGFVERAAPELVIASGDLTHRGRPDQHDRAAAFLRSLGSPVLAVPGNHDIPYTFPARFTRTLAQFTRVWQDAQPVFPSQALFVVGLNTVRAWRHQSGGLRSHQLAWAAERLADAPPGALRVVVMHHQMIGAPWRTRKKPVARRNRVLAALVDAGAELILSGHTHQGAVAERHEFEVWAGDQPGVTVSTAPGLGQPRPRRRGEARGLHVYDAEPDQIRVFTYVWRAGEWGLTAARRFPRGREALVEIPQ
jgi:3',5'-cyclic AMP phosphodiesterase CpdA